MTRRRQLWGWTPPARALLVALSLVGAIALGLGSAGTRETAPLDPTLVIDPNQTPAAVLVSLPRLGPVLAGRIVEERRRRPFVSLHDLDVRVRGIGPATVSAIRPHVRFGSDDGPSEAPASRLAARGSAASTAP